MSKRPEESDPLWAAVIGGCELPAWVVGMNPGFLRDEYTGVQLLSHP